MNNIKPFGTNILVLPTEVKTALATRNASRTAYGKVIAIGKEVREIKVGDTIGFVEHGLLSLDVDKTKLFFIPESSDFLLATFTD